MILKKGYNENTYSSINEEKKSLSEKLKMTQK